MALQFEVKSLDDLDESIKALYVAHGNVFRLSVEGIDPADELKEALKKERALSSESKAKAKALEDANKLAEEARATEKGEYKTLWERQQEETSGYKTQLETLKQTVAEKDKHLKVQSVIGALTKDEAKADALKGIVSNYISTDQDGNVIYSQGGIELTKAKLVEQLTATYHFLVDGSKAEGGNSQGNKGQGAQTTNPFKKGENFNLTEQSRIRRENPELAKSLKAQA